MDSDDREILQNQIASDAHMIRMIPQEDDAVANGTVLSISLCDGKVTTALFSFLKTFNNIFVECYEEGFQFIGFLTNKNSKLYEEVNETKVYDMISYMSFRKNKILEYFFCPNNMSIESYRSAKSLTFMLSMNQISTLMKKSKIKALTTLRFDFNGRTNNFCMYVSHNGSFTPYTLDFQLVDKIKCPIPGSIVSDKLTPNYKINVDMFGTMISNAAAKSDNVAYDYSLAIYKGGIALQTDAPCVGPISYGIRTDNPNIFKLSHDSTKYFGLIPKITPRGILLLTCLDDSIFKVSFPIGSCGDGFIFQFPKQSLSQSNLNSPVSSLGSISNPGSPVSYNSMPTMSSNHLQYSSNALSRLNGITQKPF